MDFDKKNENLEKLIDKQINEMTLEQLKLFAKIGMYQSCLLLKKLLPNQML